MKQWKIQQNAYVTIEETQEILSYTPSHKEERKERQQRKTTKQRSETKHKTFKHFFLEVKEQVIEGRLGDVPM